MGLTVSIGLAPNRLLAKLAAGLDKPRGFAVLGADAPGILADWPVRRLPGIGPALERRLAGLGITHLGHLQALDGRAARARLGDDGPSLARRARGEDMRVVTTDHDTKRSAPKPPSTPTSRRWRSWNSRSGTCPRSWPGACARRRSPRGGVVLKLKTARFALRTRAARLPGPDGAALDVLFAAARGLLLREADGTAFRLIGIGAAPLAPGAEADRGTWPIRMPAAGSRPRRRSMRCGRGSGTA